MSRDLVHHHRCGRGDPSVDYELPLLALTRGTLRWKTPLAGLKVRLTGSLAKPTFDPTSLPGGAGPWRLELSRVIPSPGTLRTYYVGQVPALTCSATGRTCAGTVNGTVPSGRKKLGLRLKRGRNAGEWSFRVSVSDDAARPRPLGSDGPALAMPARRGAVPVAEYPFAGQGSTALRYRPSDPSQTPYASP